MADDKYIPEERFSGYIGEVIDNANLICRDCKFLQEGGVSACEKYAQKPASVLRGENTCAEYEKM